MIDEIILIQLVNNDQYIGTLIEEDDQGIRLDNPLKIEIEYIQSKYKPNVIILPWNELSAMSEVYFDRLHILYFTIPKDDVIEFYNKQISNSLKDEDEPAEQMDSNVIRAFIEKMTSNTTIN
jgi:hypothetical protein